MCIRDRGTALIEIRMKRGRLVFYGNSLNCILPMIKDTDVYKRQGTDGSKISFMGIPTPNIFAGGENMHGRFEYVSLQTMERAVDTIIGIVTKK